MDTHEGPRCSSLHRPLYNPTVTEIVFLVEDDPDGGYTARSVGAAIFT